MAAHAITPRAGRLDRTILFPPSELRFRFRYHPLHLLAGVLEAVLEILETRHDETRSAAQHLRFGLRAAARQMHLGPAEVDPHVLQAVEEIGIAGAAQADDVKQRRQALVADDDVEVLEMDDVAHGLG